MFNHPDSAIQLFEQRQSELMRQADASRLRRSRPARPSVVRSVAAARLRGLAARIDPRDC